MTQIINSYKDKLTFGKHKGKLFEQVLSENSQYIKWCLDENIIKVENKEIQNVVNTCIAEDYNLKQIDDNDNWDEEEKAYWENNPY